MLKTQHFLPSPHPNNCQTKDNSYKPTFLIPVSYNSDSHLETVLLHRGHVAMSGDTAGPHNGGRRGRFWPMVVKARAAPPNRVTQPQTPTVPRVRSPESRRSAHCTSSQDGLCLRKGPGPGPGRAESWGSASVGRRGRRGRGREASQSHCADTYAEAQGER